MSSGVAKRQRRKLQRQPEQPKRHDLAALKTARRAQSQLVGARAQVMAKRGLESGLARELADEKARHRKVRYALGGALYVLALTLLALTLVIAILVATT